MRLIIILLFKVLCFNITYSQNIISGKIIDEENLKSRIKASTNTLLIHGDLDQVVQPSFMLEAKDFFIRNNIKIETYLIKNCDHNIPIEASSIALNYIKKKFHNC